MRAVAFQLWSSPFISHYAKCILPSHWVIFASGERSISVIPVIILTIASILAALLPAYCPFIASFTGLTPPYLPASASRFSACHLKQGFLGNRIVPALSLLVSSVSYTHLRA